MQWGDSQYTSGLDTMSKALPSAVNYHRWVYRQVEPYLGDRILDVGGGTGNHTGFLLAHERVVVVDAGEDCLAMLKERHGEPPNLRVVIGDICDPEIIRMGIDEQITTVTCFNVLEHIQDHHEALRSMRAVLEPTQGNLILFVPALELLQGAMDDAAGHFRRYSKPGLRTTLTECGFRVHRLFYMNAFGAIGWFINSRILKQRNLSADAVSAQIMMFDRMIVPVIAWIERRLRPPFGQSLIAVAQAKGSV